MNKFYVKPPPHLMPEVIWKFYLLAVKSPTITFYYSYVKQ